jgi:peptidoglycan/LPS O-acetylase OafA/YrhL
VYFGYFGVALIFASLAWYCLAVPNNLVARFLSWRGFFLIARLSYGMYLMHQPVSVPVSRFLINTFPSLPGAAMFGIVISATILASMLAATLGYLLVEQPFMRLRSRLESLAHRPQPATEMALAQVTGNR